MSDTRFPGDEVHERGLRQLLEGNEGEAIESFRLALEQGLSESDEISCKGMLGALEVSHEMEEVGLPRIEASLEMDATRNVGVFEDQMIRISVLQEAVPQWALQASTLQEEEGPLMAVDYLIERLRLLEHIGGGPPALLSFQLGSAYAALDRDDDAMRAFRDAADEGSMVVFSKGGGRWEYEQNIKATAQENLETLEARKSLEEADEARDDTQGCWVATAAYGAPKHVDIDVLREFRRCHLRPHFLGRVVLYLYGMSGPSIANWLATHPGLKRLVRDVLIRPVVALIRRSGLHDRG